MARVGAGLLRVVGKPNGEPGPQVAIGDFDWFWSEYPKKKAKLDALRAWRQTESVRPDIEQVIAAINEQCKQNDWIRDGGQYIPMPATWLRGGRWDDE